MAAYIYKTKEKAEAAAKRKMQKYKGLEAHIQKHTKNGKPIGYSVYMY